MVLRRRRLVYVNVNDLIGFEIGDVKTGKMLERFEIPGSEWKGKGYRHGIGMTPDESEIWVADPFNNAWQMFDWSYAEALDLIRHPVCAMPPVPESAVSDAQVAQIVAYLKTIK